MAIQIDFQQHDDHLAFNFAGPFNLNEAVAKFSLVSVACQATQLTKVLLDYREITGTVTDTEKMIYAYRVARMIKDEYLVGRAALRIAYLGTPRLISTAKPGLKIALAEGIDANTFTDAHEAIAWLRRPAACSDEPLARTAGHDAVVATRP